MAITSRVSGYLFAGSSIMLTTIAQLLMKSGMIGIPPLDTLWNTPLLLSQYPLSITWVILGIMGYMLSMGCWLGALHYLPLNRAYPLLSISYILVCFCTAILPWYHETLSLTKILGVLSIMLGVWLITRFPHANS